MEKSRLENFTGRVERTVYDWLTKPLFERGRDHAEVVPPPASAEPEGNNPGDAQAGSSRPLPPHRQPRTAPPIREVHATAAALSDSHVRLKSLLLQPRASREFKSQVIEAAKSLTQVVANNPDSSLFHLMHGPSDKFAVYSVVHSMQCAAACGLVAERLGWSAAERESIVSAALTMNIGMGEIQGTLAVQAAPPTDTQRAAIREHPVRGAMMLEESGVHDSTWLRIVREHHETPDARGYPAGIAACFEPAELLRHVDIFMAKIKSRANRKAIPPNEAVREIFRDSGNSRMAAAVVREFGIYPPGIFVRLASGELGIVVARGEAVNKPIVGVLVNKSGEAPTTPIRRDSAAAPYAIIAVIKGENVMARVDPALLYA